MYIACVRRQPAGDENPGGFDEEEADDTDPCLGWTHNGVNPTSSDGRSLTQTWKELFRSGSRWCEGSLSNRRLTVFRILQAVCEESVWVQCNVFIDYHHKFSETRSLTTENEGFGVRPNSRANRWRTGPNVNRFSHKFKFVAKAKEIGIKLYV